MSNTYFKNADGKDVLLGVVKAIQENKAYLGEIDGLIGDGDHGMNMNKGFTMFGDRIADKEISFTDGLDELGTLLFTEIGGSMGPIYGTVFTDMAEAGEDFDEIGTKELAAMLDGGLSGLQGIVDAQVGDKTLVDTLSPAKDALDAAVANGTDFATALEDLKKAADAGRESTKDLVAKFGRSARLGERSKGVYDAGATSCYLILAAIADGIITKIS
ncbi:MAG: dihydroxyacetone kinase subunit L [Clostridiales Family XIII bacterium]|jgi:dihydroxyacetone kinase-like protein|nr:dihydroxyacetone kinase subunit L [Clostridiales Family XIII bacterium]